MKKKRPWADLFSLQHNTHFYWIINEISRWRPKIIKFYFWFIFTLLLYNFKSIQCGLYPYYSNILLRSSIRIQIISIFKYRRLVYTLWTLVSVCSCCRSCNLTCRYNHMTSWHYILPSRVYFLARQISNA